MGRYRVERRIARELRQQLRQRSGLPDLGRLTAPQLAAYNAWKADHDYWTRRVFGDDRAGLVEAMLDGWRGPEMPSEIATTLFGPEPTISANIDDLSRIWDRMRDNQ